MYTSEQSDLVCAALVAAQPELTDLTKDTQGYGYKYATLDQLLGMARPVLARHGLAVLQDVQADTAGEIPTPFSVVTTRLIHSSGQFIESSGMLVGVEERKGLSEMQLIGINVTYSRRYQLQAMLGITAEEDTDAKKDEGKTPPKVALARSRVAAVEKLAKSYPRRGDPEHGISERQQTADDFSGTSEPTHPDFDL